MTLKIGYCKKHNCDCWFVNSKRCGNVKKAKCCKKTKKGK